MPGEFSIVATEFHHACATHRGCPLCHLRAKALARYLASVLYEGVNDGIINDRLRDSGGYCHTHAWMFQRQDWTGETDGLGVALIYERLLGHSIERIHRLKTCRARKRRGLAEAASKLLRALSGDGSCESSAAASICPACDLAGQSDNFATAEIANLLESDVDSPAWNWLSGSFGLCLPHMRFLLDKMRCPTPIHRLCLLEEERIAELRARLNEYARKHNYIFSSEGITNEERTSWKDAVAIMVGDME